MKSSILFLVLRRGVTLSILMVLVVVLAVLLWNYRNDDLTPHDATVVTNKNEASLTEADFVTGPRNPSHMPFETGPDRTHVGFDHNEIEPEYVDAVGDPAFAEPTFRLCAILSGAGHAPSVGIVDRETGRGSLLKVGDSSRDGWRLASVDFGRERATFEKQRHCHTMHLEIVESFTDDAIKPMPSQHATEDGASRQSSSLFKNRGLAEAFGESILLDERGEEVSLRGVDGAPEVVEFRAGGNRYALRRDIVETILSIQNLAPEDRLGMLFSYPGVAQVLPDQDAATQASEAERKLSEELIPPTNTPSIKSLHLLMERINNP